jgi:putative endonuclease
MLQRIFGKRSENVGVRGENASVHFLQKNGYKIIARNWYNRTGKRLGEIDIIALDKKTKEFVFVEVKTRVASNGDDLFPEEQIVPQKLHKLQKAVECYIKENDLWDKMWRFDAVAVVFKDKSKDEITHIKNIFF